MRFLSLSVIHARMAARQRAIWVASLLLALLSFLLAEGVMVLGYFLLEWALYGVASAAAAIGPNVVQGIAGVLIGMLCLLIAPRLERVAKL